MEVGMRMIRKAALVAASMLIVVVFVSMNNEVSEFLASVKYGGTDREAVTALVSDTVKLDLLQTIKAEAEKRRVAPIDAKIDRVWKAIPGYNGIEVDIERTLEATLQAPADGAIHYVYKEIEPNITLDELGAYPIYRGNPSKKMISLMINVAWGNEYIEPILKTLKQEQVKATFFLDGSWLKKYPEVAKQIQQDGHEMSNHAYTHPDMRMLSRQDARLQISKTEELLRSTLNVNNKWFAPPSGSFNQATVQIAAEQGLKTVLWTIDTIDWQKPTPDTVLRRVTPKLSPGALILMHPTASTRDAIGGIIAAAKSKGYALGTVSETLSSARVPASVEGESGF